MPASGDIHRYGKKLESQIRLVKAEGFTDEAVLLDYARMLEAHGLNKGRVSKGLFLLREMRKRLGCDFKDADKAKLQELTVWVNDHYRAWTRSDALGILKRFYRWLRLGVYEGPYPPEVAWIKSGVKRNELSEPDILSSEEAESMIRVADKLRDKAFIAVDFEGGFRIGEMLGMKIGDVSFDHQGARVRVSGKTGGRTVRLITSSPILSRWVEAHHLRESPDAPVWVTLDHNSGRGQRISYQSASKIIIEAARKAGLKKRVYPHLFRHSAATRDAHHLNEAELRIKYGWERDSKIPSTYVHLAGRDVEDKLISVYGQSGKVEPLKPEFVVQACVKCGEKNTPGVRFCGRCGTPLDQRELAKSSVEISELRELVEKAMRELSEFRK